MRKLTIVLLCFACMVCSQAPVSSSDAAIGDGFPADFKERAFQHISQLAKFGPRSPGGNGETRAFRYIRQQLEKTGLVVRVEEFEFEAFRIEQIELTICGEEIDAETLGFNPYGGSLVATGKPLFVGPERTRQELGELGLEGKIVVTTSPVDYFSLLYLNPRMIVYVSNADFSELSQKACSSCNVAITGVIETHASANIIGELASGKSDVGEVIISAHWDSYRDSPGADDNGSGVAVLLELARLFTSLGDDLGGTLKFVFFGGEELGVVGSRAYLDAHYEDLQRCRLLFNIDQIGGPIGPAVEVLGGVQGIPERKGTTQFPASIRKRTLEGLDGRWRIIEPELIEAFMVANRPAWLVRAIETTAEQLGLEFRPTGNMGSDQQVFTQAGIVATSIGTSGNRYHSAEDVPDQINIDKLELVGQFVANTVRLSLSNGDTK